MARVKLRVGENEIEVDSRDFYVDNQSIGDVIESLSEYLPKNQTKVMNYTEDSRISNKSENPQKHVLEYLDDAEAFEPEFNEPKPIGFNEIKGKLSILETSNFFDSPKTVTEIVQQLREYGWAASQLDVSKSLAKMASNKEIMKGSRENRACYFVNDSLVAN